MPDQPDDEYSAIVPLSSQGGRSHDAALRAFAAGEGLLVAWRPAAVPAGSRLGQTLGSASPIVNALTHASQKVGRGPSGNLFRIELPAGQAIGNLVPAIGGGFRGITRTVDTKIAGHARLLPIGAGTAGALASGPLIGLLALSAASQMLAQKQMNDKLAAIHGDVLEIRDSLREHDAAVLPLADNTLREASHFLLDRVEVPTTLGADTIFGRLKESYEIRLARLATWEEITDQFVQEAAKRGAIDGPELMHKLLRSEHGGIDDFVQLIEDAYRTFALMARLTIVNRIEAAVRDPLATMPNVDRLVADRLRSIADNQARLVDVVGKLSSLPSTTGVLVMPGTESRAIRARAGMAALAHRLYKAPPAVPVLTPSHRPVIEVYGKRDGTFAVVQPEAA